MPLCVVCVCVWERHDSLPPRHTVVETCISTHGVATISRLLKIIGLFCKRDLLKRRYSTKEPYNFKEPTNRSHPIHLYSSAWHIVKTHTPTLSLSHTHSWSQSHFDTDITRWYVWHDSLPPTQVVVETRSLWHWYDPVICGTWCAHKHTETQTLTHTQAHAHAHAHAHSCKNVESLGTSHESKNESWEAHSVCVCVSECVCVRVCVCVYNVSCKHAKTHYVSTPVCAGGNESCYTEMGHVACKKCVFVCVQCVMQRRRNSRLLYNCVRWGQCIMPHRNGHGVHRNELCRPSEWINTQTVVEIRSYRPWRDKQICLLYAIWLIHTCDMYDSFICVSWLVPFCNMTKFCVTWLIASNMTSRSASYV